MIGAKVNFLNEVQKRSAGFMTVSQMEEMVAVLKEVLDEYHIFEIVAEDVNGDDLVECYLNALTIQGRSPKTISRYKREINRMLQQAGVSVRNITVYHLRNYLTQEKNRGISDATLEGTREIFSSFFNWLQRESLIDRNPVSNLGPIHCEKKERKAYTEAEIERLNRGCKTTRDRAIVAFLRSTGCRITEMTSLDRDKVNLSNKECIVYGKGRKERIVCLDDVAVMLIREYLDSRKDDDPALFMGAKAQRLQPDGVRKMLKRVAKLANVGNVHPHRFRRTLATNLTRKGMPIQEVAKLLGHEKLETTMKYVVVTTEDMQNSYRRFA